MSSLHGYYFNNSGGLSADTSDQTQQNLQNVRFGNYMISNYFSDNTSDQHVRFATSQPNVFFGNSGVVSSVIDVESHLLNRKESERPLEKLQLFPRPFLTVPYLGKGYGDPTIESRLMQGESVSDKKSVSTVSEMNYMDYNPYPMHDDLRERMTNPVYSIQEASMDGWLRGGVSARNIQPNTHF